MRARWFLLALLPGVLWGCAGESARKPDEMLDERTGITWAALPKPIELIQGTQSAVVSNKPPSFAYLGPVEWNRSGDISYSLWVHVVPGSDRQVGDIHGDGAVTLMLDDGPFVLIPAEPTRVGREPYKRIASWGQTANFQPHPPCRQPQAGRRYPGNGRQRRAVQCPGRHSRAAQRISARPEHHCRLIGSTRGRLIEVPGRMSPKSTSGLYCVISHTGNASCC